MPALIIHCGRLPISNRCGDSEPVSPFASGSALATGVSLRFQEQLSVADSFLHTVVSFSEHHSMTFNFEKSRSYLVCPKCHSDLVLDGESLVCTNPQVRLRYPILEDIPRLLLEEAEVLTPEAWSAAMQRAGRSL